MGKTALLQPRDLGFARAEFDRYYRQAEIPVPFSIEMREFAFAQFGTDGAGPFVRHRAFSDVGSFRQELSRLVPRHLYYSTSLYQNPGHLSMKQKGWTGAEVIFDLDADHLRNAEGLSYLSQLQLAKERFQYLLEEFLWGDFGLDEEDVDIVFSGGRGYHAHIHADAYLHLTSMERRELVDHIQGIGFQPEEDAFETVTEALPRVHGGSRTYRRLAAPDAAGWKGRMSRAVLRWLDEHQKDTEEQMTEEVLDLLSEGLPEARKGLRQRARSIAHHLASEETLAAIAGRQTLETLGNDENRDLFLKALARRLAVPIQGETDAPVTTDVHRLIRMPGSLHGGTGFRVLPLTRKELGLFEPMRDATLPTGSNEELDVTLLQTIEYEASPTRMKGSVGDRIRVPRVLALFLILRGEATLELVIPSPTQHQDP